MQGGGSPPASYYFWGYRWDNYIGKRDRTRDMFRDVVRVAFRCNLRGNDRGDFRDKFRELCDKVRDLFPVFGDFWLTMSIFSLKKHVAFIEKVVREAPVPPMGGRRLP